MSSLFDDTPEELDALRSSVEKWLEKAANSVWSFRREDEASFWRDTEQFEDHEAGRLDKSKPPSLTATARCYMALAYARRYAKDPDVGRRADDPNIPLDWKDSVRDFVAKTRLKVDRNFNIAEWEPKKKKKQTGRRTAKTANKKKPINNFEIAHLSDFRFVCDFQNRFPTGDHDEPNHIHMIRSRRDGEFGATVSRTIRGIIEAKASATGNEDNRSVADGQVFFDPGEPKSRHFFVTLHTLRALAILEPNKPIPESVTGIVESARRFCVQQCYYSQRGERHRQDVAGLAFAGVTYCMYAQNVDRDLCVAVVEALDEAQLESGNWPSTHPVVREKKDPWYIATHEIALCLSWLYFQPRLPDAARPLLLRMMATYFTKWVIP